MNNNDWRSRVIPLDEPQQIQQPMQQAQPIQSPANDFRSRVIPVDQPQIQKESLDDFTKRNVGGAALRAGEAIAGRSGNLQKVVENSPAIIANMVGNEKLAQGFIEAKNDPNSKYAQIVNEAVKKRTGQEFEHPANQPSGLPTTESLRELTKKVTGEKFEPQGEGEKAFQETVGDVASIFSKDKLLKSAGLGVLGQTAKQTALGLGSDESAADNYKTGAMIIGSAVNPGQLTRNINKLYNQAARHLPENAEIGSKIIQRRMNLLKREMNQGEKLPWKKAVLDSVDAINDKIKNGKIKVSDLKQHITDIYDKIGTWDTPKKANKYLKQLTYDANRNIKQYGKTNPEWYSKWSEAQGLKSALHQSKAAGRYLYKAAQNYPKVSGLGGALYAAFNPSHIALAAPAYLGLKTTELMQRIFTNPKSAKYYFNALQNSMKENQAAVVKNLYNLDKELKKQEE